MARKSFLKTAGQGDTMSLQITSMADVFIIILVFLLKSYASGSVEITPSKGVTLPTAGTSDHLYDALKVEIGKEAVLVEGQPVAVKELGDAFKKERERQLVISKNNPDVKIDARMIVVADQGVPYATIKSVLASASAYGYSDFKLAVATDR